jgi:hypothetical protein
VTVEELLQRIRAIPSETRKVMPFPESWIVDHQVMLQLVDAGILGMDGFKYCFPEYAKDCWRRCNGRATTIDEQKAQLSATWASQRNLRGIL